jgi:oligoribonuclease
MTPEVRWLVWIDLETTGDDPVVDQVLEVAALLTPASTPWTVTMEFGCVVKPRDNSAWRLRLKQLPEVERMHADSGLLASLNAGYGLDAVAAEIAIVKGLLQHGSQGDFMLAGSGVGHFDKAFLRHHFPTLHSWLVYPVLDVGVIRRALRLVGVDLGVELNERKTHRAGDDVRLHLAEWRAYADVLADLALERRVPSHKRPSAGA